MIITYFALQANNQRLILIKCAGFKYNQTCNINNINHLLVTLLKQDLCSFPENNSRPMMAYMIMTNNTSRAIWNKGTMARKIELRTTCKPVKYNKTIVSSTAKS